MTQEIRWTYYPWTDPASVQLRFADLIETQPPLLTYKDRLPDFVQYADMSYLACRILMISSITVHPAALYMASQTIEMYMKVLLLKLREEIPRTHRLTRIATQVYDALAKSSVDPSITSLFANEEFLKLCTHLQKFAVGGRYPPKDMAGWRYTLNLLAFLDEFVVQCRALIGISRNTPNIVASLLGQETSSNSVMEAAVTAVRDNNHHVDVLLNPPLPSDAPLTLAMLEIDRAHDREGR